MVLQWNFFLMTISIWHVFVNFPLYIFVC